MYGIGPMKLCAVGGRTYRNGNGPDASHTLQNGQRECTCRLMRIVETQPARLGQRPFGVQQPPQLANNMRLNDITALDSAHTQSTRDTRATAEQVGCDDQQRTARSDVAGVCCGV